MISYTYCMISYIITKYHKNMENIIHDIIHDINIKNMISYMMSYTKPFLCHHDIIQKL